MGSAGVRPVGRCRLRGGFLSAVEFLEPRKCASLEGQSSRDVVASVLPNEEVSLSHGNLNGRGRSLPTGAMTHLKAGVPVSS